MDELIEKYAKVPAAQRYAAAAGVALLLIAYHYFMIYGDQQSEIEQLSGRMQKVLKQEAAKEKVAKNLSSFETRLVRLQQELDTAKSLLPDDANVPELLAQLGNVARKTGLEIDKFVPTGEKVSKGDRDFYAEIGFKMDVTGTFHEIAMFIDSVGRLDRIINIRELKMRNPRSEDQKVLVDGSFSIKTYRFISQEERK